MDAWKRTEKGGAMHSKYLISPFWYLWVRPAVSGAGPGGARAIWGHLSLVTQWWWYEAVEKDCGGWDGESFLQTELEEEWPQAPPWCVALGAAWSALFIRGCVMLPKHSQGDISNHFGFSHQCTMEENLSLKPGCCWDSVGWGEAAGTLPAIFCNTQTKCFFSDKIP